MFHWICPECGLEIAPTAKECPACEPQTCVTPNLTQTQPAAVGDAHPLPVTTPMVPPPATVRQQVLTPEPLRIAAPAVPRALLPPAQAVQPDIVAPLGARVLLAPLAPAIPAKFPLKTEAGPEHATPVPATLPRREQTLPAPQTAGILRPPQASLKMTPALRLAEGPIASLDLMQVPEMEHVTLPKLAAPGGAEPRLAAALDIRAAMVAGIRPASGSTAHRGGGAAEQISLPGPTLPHELTSLDAAGIARVLSDRRGHPAPPRGSGWFLSVLVASGLFAVAIAGVFYAVPGFARPQLANSAPVPQSRPPVIVPEQKQAPERRVPASLEITGIRFVTKVPNRPPQIHYLVVNHTAELHSGAVVRVTLRTGGNEPPLSQFSFRSPRLGGYESKEMISSIERLNRPLDLPDWRDVRADVQIEP